MAGRAGRTYKRDGRGRFASTGTSGKKSRPPAKTVAKGVNKLTRDNAGKITSVGGDGATARGGRLKTAAGNLRATQTKRLKTMQGVSYGKPAAKTAAKGSKAATSKLRPGEGLYMYSPKKDGVILKKVLDANKDPFGAKKPTIIKGVQRGLQSLAAMGFYNIGTFKDGRGARTGGQTAAQAYGRVGRIELNEKSGFWKSPREQSKRNYEARWWSTGAPRGVLHHEIGHVKDPSFKEGSSRSVDWYSNYKGGKSAPREIAKRVSNYAAKNSKEFVAETYAGLRTGRRYDREVMSLYRELMGSGDSNLARRRVTGMTPGRVKAYKKMKKNK